MGKNRDSAVKSLKYCLLMIIFIGMSLVARQAAAVMVPDTTCDQAVLDVMDKRASLQSMREMEVAQSIIKKPDSVLQYSCFKQFASGMGATGDTLKILDKHLQSNFNYDGAPGAYKHSGDPCAFMYAMWEFSKCSNIDGSLFNTLDVFMSGDPRNFPQMCNKPARNTFWQTEYPLAHPNHPGVDPSAPDPLIEAATNYMPTVLDVMDPLKCEDHTPLDTGLRIHDFIQVKVISNDPDAGAQQQRGIERFERPDRFCPAPGCYYQYDEFDLEGPGKCLSKP